MILNTPHFPSIAHVPVPLSEALRRRGETRRVSAYVGYRSDLYATSTDSQKSWHGPTRAGTCTCEAQIVEGFIDRAIQRLASLLLWLRSLLFVQTGRYLGELQHSS